MINNSIQLYKIKNFIKSKRVFLYIILSINTAAAQEIGNIKSTSITKYNYSFLNFYNSDPSPKTEQNYVRENNYDLKNKTLDNINLTEQIKNLDFNLDYTNNSTSSNNLYSNEKKQDSINSISTFLQKGTASWYGKDFHGKKTASGIKFNMYAYTAAHRTLPLGSYIKVTNFKNNKIAIVKIIDRGPYKHSRVIDLSFAAAKHLDILKSGIASVKLEKLE